MRIPLASIFMATPFRTAPPRGLAYRSLYQAPRPCKRGRDDVDEPGGLARSLDSPDRPSNSASRSSGELAGFRSLRAVGQRYRIVYRVERREVTVLLVAVGRRRSGEKGDMYELARKLCDRF